FLQVFLRIVNTLRPIPEIMRSLKVAGFLKQKRPTGGGFDGSAIAFAADTPIENDPRPPQQLDVLVPKDAIVNGDPIGIGKPGQPAQMREPFALYRRIQVANKKNVDVTR